MSQGLSAAGSAPGAGPFVSAVHALAVEAQSRCSGPALEAVSAARRHLTAPVRVAVVGRVSSGKSTLVNALLDTRIAPTAAGECTRVPCRYRYGQWGTAALRTVSGESIPLSLAGGRLPLELPVEVSRIATIDVTIPVPLLRSYTLVDTPGIASGSLRSDADTRAAPAARTLQPDAPDALILVINGSVKLDEAAAVDEFRTRSTPDPLAAGTAVAVLSKADQLADRAETWQVAEALCDEITVSHRARFATVVPVVGLLGETGTTGQLRESDVGDLAALAAAWDETEVELALSDHQLFVELPAPVPRERRIRLATLLGLFGVAELLVAVRDGTARTAGDLSDRAEKLSGVSRLRDVLTSTVARQADIRKAGTALRTLGEAAAMAGGTAWLGDHVQALADSEALFPVRVLTAAAWVASGRVRPPDPLATEVATAAAGALGSVDRGTAAERAGAWRSWKLFADGAGQHVSDVMIRAWQLAARSEP